jgi:cobalt-zinc-cadmium resistance protein CzcA
LKKIIQYSLNHKLIILLLSFAIVAFGSYALSQISIGAVPDITNNQVQVITTSRNLATEDVERYLTYPVELEMANLPGVKEIRSVSKFGLSVVTIVFDDDLGTYLPRQLIAEKLLAAERNIPEDFGVPFMGPITTGLGEIYQYTLEVDSAYRDQYSITDLRTIQDWIVKRQLSGINGVVEVNTWGGYLKQYQVAIKPVLLRSLNVNLDAVYRALKQNNGLAGGAYIEKGDQSYFIRSEGLAKSIQDIENIVVEKRGSRPILVKDLATVKIDAAPRFGAITANGQGERVMGQVMMLKDANSKKVIESVKDRVAEISANLPEGIYLNPFLERSELIGKTTFTIAENLILGCLIVIFVVVLLLGNFRSGMVVASMIPITLLFAISLMYVFGIDANLMSLGAIDFGIIIDGAVIIVEYIAYRITREFKVLEELSAADRRVKIDGITLEASHKMMHSAVFGQLIIIIVFIPILSLAGVEGKMFRPMALVFSFALSGAMLLCFTYVPVMASLFLKPKASKGPNFANRIMHRLEAWYRPSLSWALGHARLVIAAAFTLFLAAVVLFTRMGGEFVPTLDEGDYVIQPVLKTGTSLERTIELTTKMEQILKGFPEVDQVVSRIGAAEVPTDPMSMEEADVIIKLKPRGEWQTAETKDDLANRFKEALMIIPGVDYEFTQPIEMRFNELITGVRADLAIKIFGEDLDVLSSLAHQISAKIEDVPGAADISVEKIVGLPQVKVSFKRAQMARYGLDVESLNQYISAGFAGAKVGSIFEGEKQFDISLRFDADWRNEPEDLAKIRIETPDGASIPLSAVADISLTKGPAKVSRDDTKRRIVVGVNVRNRDLESVVEDVQAVLKDEIKLPEGYFVEYGGQFQNLRSARTRLSYAVPLALLLIFILLYFAFNSVQDAIMIFSAIPLSAVGGIIFLYLRGLPFSISAGVGFIALFGIAVLNGIVLIEEFKELKKKSMDSPKALILKGSLSRLRPVLLTASAAALGFLPMAISTSAGAEVQRPLATVVIGGLISSTALTLMVLPALYYLRERAREKRTKANSLMAVLLVGALIPQGLEAQSTSYSLEDLEQLALQENFALKAAELAAKAEQELISGSASISPTSVYYSFDENNIAENNAPIRVWGVEQEFNWPGKYRQEQRLQRAKYQKSLQESEMAKAVVLKSLSLHFYEAIYWQRLLTEYRSLDSLYLISAKAARKQFEMGDINQLAVLSMESKAAEVLRLRDEAAVRYQNSLRQIASIVQADLGSDFRLRLGSGLEPILPDTSAHQGLQLKQEELKLAQGQQSLANQMWWPGLSLGYFQGTNDLPNARIYQGYQIGLSIPLWFAPQQAQSQATEIRSRQKQAELADYRQQLNREYQNLLAEASHLKEVLGQYQELHLPLARKLRSQAEKSWQEGEIAYLEYLQLLDRSLAINTDYHFQRMQYAQKLIELKYLLL